MTRQAHRDAAGISGRGRRRRRRRKILVTNRGAASLAWLDAATLETKAVFKTGARPNGAAIVKRLSLGHRRLHRRRSRGPDAASLRAERSQAGGDRSAGPAAVVRDRRQRRAAIPLHPRAVDGAGCRPAGPAPDRAMEAAVGWRTWSRHRPRARAPLCRLRRRRAGRNRQRLRRCHQRLADRRARRM